MAFGAHQAVEHVVGRAQVVRDAFPLLVVEGDVGKSADVQAVIVLRKQELVADGHQGCSLSAESHVECTEVADHRNAASGIEMGTIAYLEVVSQIGTMKDRVAVRGNEIDLLDPLFADELLDFLS